MSKDANLECDGEAGDGEEAALGEEVGPGDGDGEITDIAIYKLYWQIC